MSNRKYIINCADAKENGFIDNNFEDILLSAIIWRVQEIRIQAVLGTELYNHVLNLIEIADGDSSAIAEPYRTLCVDYILPCIIPMIEERVCEHNPRVTNKAIGEYSDANLSASDKRGTTSLKQKFAQDSAHYRNLLIKYLVDNTADFEEYVYGQECTGYNPEKKSSSLNSMIFISGGRRRKNNCCDW